MTIPDADVILAAFRSAREGVDISERGVRAAVQHARGIARWPIEEPAAIFFAFGCRRRIAPKLGIWLTLFLVRDQLDTLGLKLNASDDELRELRMKILHRDVVEADVVAWFAERMPVE